MAWNDKPTDGQIGELMRAYDANYLLEELDHAKETGAYIKEQAIDELEDERVLLNAVRKLAERSNRAIFSDLIKRADREYYIDPSVKKAIDDWLKSNYDVELDYDRIRQEWIERRER